MAADRGIRKNVHGSPLSYPPTRYSLPYTEAQSSSYGTSSSSFERKTPTARTASSEPLQLKRLSVGGKNDEERSHVKEDEDDKLFQRLDGILGLDEVVRGAQFAIHSGLVYPFTIIQRQFQVFPYYNITLSKSMPWHTLAIMRNITLSQGVYSWWRGWQAQSIYLIGRPVVGAIVSRLIEPLKNKRTSRRSLWLKKKAIHLIVDGVTYAVCMPLVSFILMQSVQADIAGKTYSSDYAGFKEFIVERPLISPGPSNLLSYLNLLGPTLLLSIFNDLLSAGVTPLVGRFTKNNVPHKPLPCQVFNKLLTKMASSFLVDLILYPLLTVTIRLHSQGLPILVSNMETGSGVQYVQTYYSGPLDCVNGIWVAEGVAGFYKGLSALLIQYAVEGLVLFMLWKGVAYWERFRQRNRSSI